ncbi:AAA family ATPase [Pseudonocardia lacus]|uniref:AAA family ATPase n=1 Tax=Pseudonocardia lacus TaxID=2835865 RepID=UPI001BDC84DA|nr:AAA family ATPase [Pseudonocardia lacus]
MTSGLARIIADEQATDDRYRKALERSREDRVTVRHGPGTRHTPPRTVAPAEKGLVGRVALAEPTDLFDGLDFYIGSGHVDEDQLVVFSWAAPIASTFFRGRARHELCDQVAVTRTLVRRRGRIDDYIDDDGPARGTEPPFATRALTVPKAPARRRLPGRSAPRERPAAVAEPVPKPRAERAMLAAIAAPRRERLSSVLATLQPEQYDLVTADPDATLVVQGPPGTGKTIIAAHRAAFLAHREQGRERVLVVGPTEHYRHHIQGVLTDLVENPGSVGTASLTEILTDLRRLPDAIDDSPPTQDRDVEAHLAELAEYTANLLRTTGGLRPRSAHADQIVAVYEALRVADVGRYRVTRDVAWRRYLRALPDLRVARRSRRHLPLLAACSLAVASPSTTYDHVVVDEAQDLTPLEWAVLRQVNPAGGWTLLGDMSQRRFDWSCPSWPDVVEELGTPGSRTEELRRGYRTSAEIMRYADRLLPRLKRTVDSLQAGGTPPRQVKVRPTEVSARVAEEATELLGRHPGGTVAVIALIPAEVMRALRRAGFTVDPHDVSKLVRQGRAVRVLNPEQARGLEFDAVVVVEPSAFPTRAGQHGLLYTSLTRANRELVVVHSEPLPRELRARPPARTRSIPAQRLPDVRPIVCAQE